MPTALARQAPEQVLYKIPEVMAMLRMSRHVVYEQIRADGCASSSRAAPRSLRRRPSAHTSNCLNARPRRARPAPR